MRRQPHVPGNGPDRFAGPGRSVPGRRLAALPGAGPRRDPKIAAKFSPQPHTLWDGRRLMSWRRIWQESGSSRRPATLRGQRMTGPRSAHAACGCRWQEQDPADPARRLSQPTPNRGGSVRESGLERRTVFHDSATDRSVLRKDEHPRHGPHLPSTLAGDGWRESCLSVKRHEHAADVRHDRLHLDDQERTCSRVERQDVDRASLPVTYRTRPLSRPPSRRVPAGRPRCPRALRGRGHAVGPNPRLGTEREPIGSRPAWRRPLR